MIDRGIIKWQPFNTIDNNQILKDITVSKNRIKFPILSEDQLKIIQEKVITAYNLKNIIQINYFYDGKIWQVTGQINYLNITKKVLLINKNSIHFSQILKISEL